jgi:hypothetical protein
MVSKKNSPITDVTDAEDVPVVVSPVVSEKTRLEMEAGRAAAQENAAKMAQAEAARLADEKAKLTAEAEEKQKQADDKLRAVEEAEAAHRAKAGA